MTYGACEACGLNHHETSECPATGRARARLDRGRCAYLSGPHTRGYAGKGTAGSEEYYARCLLDRGHKEQSHLIETETGQRMRVTPEPDTDRCCRSAPHLLPCWEEDCPEGVGRPDTEPTSDVSDTRRHAEGAPRASQQGGRGGGVGGSSNWRAVRRDVTEPSV